MNADLEETLKELGPEYRTVVVRLRAGLEAEDVGGGERRETRDERRDTRNVRRGMRRETRNARVWGLLAASLLVVLSFSIYLRTPQTPQTLQTLQTPQTLQTLSRAPREYRMTPAEMIASQRADGSWANDFLTRRNAEALRDLDDPRAQVAYKKAMRNLRLRQAL